MKVFHKIPLITNVVELKLKTRSQLTLPFLSPLQLIYCLVLYLCAQFLFNVNKKPFLLLI